MFVEDVNYGGSNKTKEIIFKEECVNIPLIVITENDQVSSPIIVQPVNQSIAACTIILVNPIVNEEKSPIKSD